MITLISYFGFGSLFWIYFLNYFFLFNFLRFKTRKKYKCIFFMCVIGKLYLTLKMWIFFVNGLFIYFFSWKPDKILINPPSKAGNICHFWAPGAKCPSIYWSFLFCFPFCSLIYSLCVFLWMKGVHCVAVEQLNEGCWRLQSSVI